MATTCLPGCSGLWWVEKKVVLKFGSVRSWTDWPACQKGQKIKLQYGVTRFSVRSSVLFLLWHFKLIYELVKHSASLILPTLFFASSYEKHVFRKVIMCVG